MRAHSVRHQASVCTSRDQHVQAFRWRARQRMDSGRDILVMSISGFGRKPDFAGLRLAMDFAIIQPKPCNMAAARGGVDQLIPARRVSADATALLLIASASFVFLFSGVDSRAQTRA